MTLHRLGIPGLLRTSLSSTNLVESALSFFEAKGHRVKRWRSGQQAERWVDMALLYMPRAAFAFHGACDMLLRVP